MILPRGQLHILEHAIFMRVAHVAGLEGIRLRVDLQQLVGDVLELDIVDMRPVARAPAHVEADLLFGQARAARG